MLQIIKIMENQLRSIIKLLRIRQWTKNLVIYIPLFFAGKILDIEDFIRTTYAFLAMCLLSSVIYVINDILDRKHDKVHPLKKERPIASGKITWQTGIFIAALLLIASLLINVFFVKSEYFLLLQLIYLALMILYSTWLKNIAIIDAMVIAGGFVLRALVGVVILQIDVSAMLTMSIIGGALLISFGKRAAEIQTLAAISEKKVNEHRPAFRGYSVKALDLIIAALVAVTFFSYVLMCYDFYKLYLDARIVELLPPTMRDSQWLMITVPFAFYVLARYLYLIYQGDIASRPEELWLKDKALLITSILWFIILFVLIYFKDVFEVIKYLFHIFN